MDIFALQRELSATETLDDILRLMKREYANIGLLEWCYIFQIVETFHTPPCICLSTFKKDWLAYYMENSLFQTDPLMKHYTSSSVPFFYNVEDDWRGFGPGACEFQQIFKEWGFWGVVCIPLITKEGTRGFISATVSSFDEQVVEQAAKVAFVTRYFNQRILHIWKNDHTDHISLHAKLSAREKEIMMAVADGMTTREIAQRLHLAPRTVDAHITSVQEKLQADNRTQALCKAVNLGLLQPDQNYSPSGDDVCWVI